MLANYIYYVYNWFMNKIILYTDGAYRRSIDRGGWGVVYDDGGKDFTKCGGEVKTTSNRMEIQAVIEGLQMTQAGDSVTIVSDSQYVVNSINKWLRNWHKTGKLYRGVLKNTDQWTIILKLMEERSVIAIWVKGHNGNEGNELADKLANKGIDKGRSEEI